MSTAPSHSTLEVDPNPLHYGSSGLELQKPPAEEQYLYPVQYEHTYTTSNAYASHEMQKQGGGQVDKGRSIRGMRRPMVYLIAIIAILAVVGAIVGGVVGSRRGREQQDDIMSQIFNILPTSSLAVSNLTTSTTYERNVFFQDAYNALILRRFNSTTNAWETRNISDSMVRTTPLDLPPGTPLASMSCNDWGCKNSAAFFLTSNNSIRGVTNAHITDGTYKYHVQTAQANLNATAGSKLAAAYHANPAPGNPGFQILAYQGTEGSLTFANSSNFTEKPQDSTALPRVVSGSSLAMVPQLNSSLLSHLKVVAEATYSSTVGAMSSLDFDGQYWVTGDQIINDISLETSTQRFAITQLNHWTDTLYMFLKSDGSITGQIIGENNRSISTIEIEGGPSVNFTTIATTLDAMLYGISNDTILEYSINQSDPSVLTYVGTVYP